MTPNSIQEEHPPNTKVFQSKKQVLDFIGRADNTEETFRLITKFKELRKSRIPFFLTVEDFDEILRWKLRRQYSRQLKSRKRNTDHNVRIITQAAFNIQHEDKDYETELRLKLLITLIGVEVPVASAMLTLCFPEFYSVIDFRNWRQIYGVAKTYANYTPKEYTRYLSIIRHMAKTCGVKPQEIDVAIWQRDIEMNNI